MLRGSLCALQRISKQQLEVGPKQGPCCCQAGLHRPTPRQRCSVNACMAGAAVLYLLMLPSQGLTTRSMDTRMKPAADASRPIPDSSSKRAPASCIQLIAAGAIFFETLQT